MTELEVYRPAAEVAVPATHDTDSWVGVVQDVIKVANVIYDTPFVPDGLRGSAPAVAAAILSGREMGLGPMTSLANIDVIKGRPTQKPLLMRAMIQSRGHLWEDVDVSDVRAVVRGRRKGESTWTSVTFSAAQAKQAGIDLGKYPADKLYARATSRLAKHKFADVIMGMAYTSDEVEDGLDAEIAVTVEGESTETPAIEQPKSRTAQRKQRTQNAPPAQAAPSAVPPSPPAGAGGALPPLPGEEEERPTAAAPAAASASTAAPASAETAPPDDTTYDTPGTATNGKGGQLTAIWTVLNTVFAFGSEEKEQARAVVEHITGHKLTGGTTASLSYNQAKTVLDTLAHWQQQAKDKGDEPRDYLIAVMVAQDKAGEPGGE